MRPKKLVLSAFLSYSNKTEIDLEKLGEAGIYLITGDTGAGKTTIFDAIAYALFGESSGQSRATNMFRSKYAKEETPTFVELVFEHNNEEIYIKRSPEYEKPLKRGEGTKIQKAEVELILPSGRIVNKISEIKDEIKELLGIDKKQFTQIAMIAQGEFLRLLHANTQDRQEIFRDIFQTKYYNTLQEKLKSETSALKGEYKRLQDGVKQYQRGIVCEEEDEYYGEVHLARQAKMPIGEVTELIDKLVIRDEKKQSEVEARKKDVEKSLEQINVIIGKAEEKNIAKKKLSQTQSEYKKICEDLEKTKIIYESEKKKEAEKEQLKKVVVTANGEIPKYDVLQEVQDKKSEVGKIKEAYIVKKENLEKDFNEKKALLNSAKAEEEQKRDAKLVLQKLVIAQESLEDKVKKANNIEKCLEGIKKLNTDIKKYRDEYVLLSKNEIALTNEYNCKYNAYLDEQAGVLAQSLVEGEPCLVCGSKSHPKPAKTSEGAPDKKSVEEAKRKSDDARKKKEKSSKEIATLEERITNGKNIIQTSVCEICEKEIVYEQAEAEFKQFKEKFAIKQADIIKKYELAKADEERLTELQAMIPKTEYAISEFQNNINSLQQSILTAELNEKNYLKNIQELKKGLEYESRAEAILNIKEKEDRIISMQQEFDVAEKNYLRNKEESDRYKGRIAELELQLKDEEQFDLEKLYTEQKEYGLKRDYYEKQIKSLAIQSQTNKNTLFEINRQSEELKLQEQKLGWVKAVCDTANGAVTGKGKIMLETYVQMTYFDKTLVRANKRLLTMSGGQYELKRQVNFDTIRGKTGLELDVYDHLNGTQRSVKTLSGGESFQASLCLALGLADEIQESASGIRIDTMFIDEGFGSLDEDSLANAIRTLSELSEGRRMVGIISHVAELKQKIEKQIVVKKEINGGSSVRIIT